MTRLPIGWQEVRLADVATKPQYGWTSSAKPDAPGLPMLRTTDIVRGALEWESVPRCTQSPPDSKRFLLAKGDIVVSRAGTVGVSALIDDPPPAIFASYLMRLRPTRKVIPRFLAWFMKSPSYWAQISEVTNGIALPNINATKLSALRLPLPPLEEQWRIVEILEDHLSRLDAAEDLVRRCVGLMRPLRLSVLAASRRRLREEGAPLRRLGDVCDTSLGKMLDAKRATGTPTRYLRNINVRWGAFDLSDVATVPLNDGERARLALRQGDLLVCEGGEPGRCAVWSGTDDLITYQKALHRIRVRDPEALDPSFVAIMLEQTIHGGRGDRLFTGTTIKHLPQERLRMIEIPVPDLGGQRQALEDLERASSVLGRTQAQLGDTNKRLSSLRRTILRAAFSGHLWAGWGGHVLPEGIPGV